MLMTPERLAAMMDSATRPRRTVPVVLDGDLRSEIEELVVEFTELQAAEEKPAHDRRLSAKRVQSARLAQIEAALDPLYARAEECTLHVVVEGLAGTPWETFRAAHRPARDTQSDKLWGFNTDLGRTPLIRDTVIGQRHDDKVVPLPDGTLEWLLGWATSWQLDALFLAALTTCRGDDAVPLRPTRSTTATSGGA